MKKNQYLNWYQCSSCPKWFSERRYLTNHLKTHEVNEYIEAFHNKPKRNSEQIVQISDSQSILMELNKLYDEHENFMSKQIKIASESNSNDNDTSSTASSSMKSDFSELDNEQEDCTSWSNLICPIFKLLKGSQKLVECFLKKLANLV